jgi:hypothetical protein
MIKNERQYRITNAEAEKFQRTLAELMADTEDKAQVHPRLVQAELQALQSQLDDLLGEIKEYEDLKSGKLSVIRLDSFAELPEGLIRARIASGLSHKALAEKLGLKEQQIQRYEADGYSSASFERLTEVAKAIGVKVRGEIELPAEDV